MSRSGADASKAAIFDVQFKCFSKEHNLRLFKGSKEEGEIEPLCPGLSGSTVLVP